MRKPLKSGKNLARLDKKDRELLLNELKSIFDYWAHSGKAFPSLKKSPKKSKSKRVA